MELDRATTEDEAAPVSDLIEENQSNPKAHQNSALRIALGVLAAVLLGLLMLEITQVARSLGRDFRP